MSFLHRKNPIHLFYFIISFINLMGRKVYKTVEREIHLWIFPQFDIVWTYSICRNTFSPLGDRIEAICIFIIKKICQSDNSWIESYTTLLWLTAAMQQNQQFGGRNHLKYCQFLHKHSWFKFTSSTAIFAYTWFRQPWGST